MTWHAHKSDVDYTDHECHISGILYVVYNIIAHIDRHTFEMWVVLSIAFPWEFILSNAVRTQTHTHIKKVIQADDKDKHTEKNIA